MTLNFPFAFILVKFTDSAAEPITVARARTLFTKVGRGGMFLVDWFDDNTHGAVDIGDSAVFGWFQLAESSTEYNEKRANGASRLRILDLGRQAAAAAGVDLSPFQNVVVVTNVEVDLFGSTAGVAATAVIAGKQRWEVQVGPSVLCQEMIHGLGVPQHARRAGSDDDYADPFDVMSMFAADAGDHPTQPDLPVGPGLNSAFMDRAGWLDQSRVLTSPMQVALRPLHRRDLPGYLAALVNGYYIEYRPKVRWDSGFTQSRVFVHTRANSTSYLEKDLGPGEHFVVGDPRGLFGAFFAVTVDAIDDTSLTATVSIQARHERTFAAGPAEIFGGVAIDGGGFIVIGGKIVRIPPRSPMLRVLEQLVAVETMTTASLPAHLEHRMKVEVLTALSADLSAQADELTELHTPIARKRNARRAHSNRSKARGQ